jgi:hypothetical protein
MRTRKAWVALVVVTVLLYTGRRLWAGDGQPESYQFTLNGTSKEVALQVKAPGPPAIVWEDVSGRGEPIRGVRIGGVSLGSRILSGSVFTLYPDRVGEWTYDFGMRRLPDHVRGLERAAQLEFIDTTFPFSKRLSDPAKPFHSVRIYPAQLTMQFRQKGVRGIAYPLDFGKDFRAQGLLLEPWRAHPDGTGRFGSGEWVSADKQGNYSLEVIVSEDENAKSVIARQVRHQPDPFYLPLPGISRFYVTFRQAAGDLSLFAGGGMRVYLHYVGQNWPLLGEGENELAYSEPGGDTGTRHLGILLHQAVPMPGFRGDLSALEVSGSGCRIEKVVPKRPEDSFLNNAGILRLSHLEAPPRGWTTYWSLPDAARDLRGVRAIRIAYRVPTWCGRIQVDCVAVYGDQRQPRYLSLAAPPLVSAAEAPVPEWRYQTKLLPDDWEQRGDVRQIVIRSWGKAWLQESDQPFSIEIGNLEFAPYLPGDRERVARKRSWQEATRKSPIRKRLDEMPLPSGPRIHPRDVFVRGMWGINGGLGRYLDAEAIGCRDEWDFRNRVLADLKAHHLNACMLEAPSYGADLDRFVKLAHEHRMYLWGHYSMLHHVPYNKPVKPETLQQNWQRLMTDTWAPFLKKWRDVPTWLAFTVGEEPHPTHLPFIQQARALQHELGAQPQLMNYNKRDTVLTDTRTEPLPAGACMDPYIFLILHTRKDKYLKYLETIWAGAKQCKGVGWVIPQLVSDTGGYAKMSPADMRFQVWTALAYNVKGFFPFHYSQAKNPDFSDKPAFACYADQMARLEAAEKLLIAIERDDALELLEPVDEQILVGSFRDRDDGAYQLAVLANMDLENAVKAVLQPNEPGQALVEIDTHDGRIALRQIKSGGTIVLEPGDGTIVFAGTLDQAANLRTRYWPD